MTRLDQNRAQAQFATKHAARVSDVSRIIIWGNHSSTQFPDVSNAIIDGKKVTFNGHDEGFISLVQKRGAAVIAARKLSSAMSAAKGKMKLLVLLVLLISVDISIEICLLFYFCC